MGLGPYPEISLADAHEKALAARRLARSGNEPIVNRRRIFHAGSQVLTWNASAPGPSTVVNQPQAAVLPARKYAKPQASSGRSGWLTVSPSTVIDDSRTGALIPHPSTEVAGAGAASALAPAAISFAR